MLGKLSVAGSGLAFQGPWCCAVEEGRQTQMSEEITEQVTDFTYATTTSRPQEATVEVGPKGQKVPRPVATGT